MKDDNNNNKLLPIRTIQHQSTPSRIQWYDPNQQRKLEQLMKRTKTTTKEYSPYSLICLLLWIPIIGTIPFVYIISNISTNVILNSPVGNKTTKLITTTANSDDEYRILMHTLISSLSDTTKNDTTNNQQQQQRNQKQFQLLNVTQYDEISFLQKMKEIVIEYTKQQQQQHDEGSGRRKKKHVRDRIMDRIYEKRNSRRRSLFPLLHPALANRRKGGGGADDDNSNKIIRRVGIGKASIGFIPLPNMTTRQVLQRYHKYNINNNNNDESTNDNDENENDDDRIFYFVHIHKSAGTTFCVAATANGMLTNYRKNCNIQNDQRCCGNHDTLAAQEQFARNSPYNFVAIEDSMYTTLDPNHYRYIILLRQSYKRYKSHYQHAKKTRTNRHSKRISARHAYQQQQQQQQQAPDDLITNTKKEMDEQRQRYAKALLFDFGIMNITVNQTIRDLVQQKHYQRKQLLELQQQQDEQMELRQQVINGTLDPGILSEYTDTFRMWYERQPDNFIVRQVCGTACRFIPKFQLSYESFVFTVNRIINDFDDLLFVERFNESYIRFANRVHWTLLPLPPSNDTTVYKPTKMTDEGIRPKSTTDDDNTNNNNNNNNNITDTSIAMNISRSDEQQKIQSNDLTNSSITAISTNQQNEEEGDVKLDIHRSNNNNDENKNDDNNQRISSSSNDERNDLTITETVGNVTTTINYTNTIDEHQQQQQQQLQEQQRRHRRLNRVSTEVFSNNDSMSDQEPSTKHLYRRQLQQQELKELSGMKHPDATSKTTDPTNDSDDEFWDPLMSVLDDVIYEYATARYDGILNENYTISDRTLRLLQRYFIEGPQRNCVNPCCATVCSKY